MPQVAIVTGGSGGIGQAVVADLIAHDWEVVSIGRSLPESKIVGAHYEVADVTQADALDAVVSRVLTLFGKIDSLITSAAILRAAPIHETSEELWDNVMKVNVKGTFLACRAVLPTMMAASSGSIVNLSSVHAEATIPGTGAYAASKGAILSLSRQMAVEYADNGIRVNAMIIGSVNTAMTAKHRDAIERDRVIIHPPNGQVGRMAEPAEIARGVRFLASADSSFVTGSAMRIDGGLLSTLM